MCLLSGFCEWSRAMCEMFTGVRGRLSTQEPVQAELSSSGCCQGAQRHRAESHHFSQPV